MNLNKVKLSNKLIIGFSLINIQNFINDQTEYTKAQGQTTQRTTATASKQMIIILFLSIVLGIIFTYFIKKSVVNQVIEAMNGASKLAEGNFDLQMNVVSNDEIGNTINCIK